jgi:hypothetical protein
VCVKGEVGSIERGGSGLNFLGLGYSLRHQALSGFFGLLKLKIGQEAFKIWAPITGLKMC